MVSDLDRHLQAAVAAVRAAALVTRAVQRELVTAGTIHKKDDSPVTVADFASQAIVCALLQQAGDTLPVVGEENADELRKPENTALLDAVVEHAQTQLPGADAASVLAAIDRGGHDATGDRYWTLDPIDGTKGFLRGEQYAVALALIEGGRVVLGVMGCARLQGEHGLLVTAARGGGAWGSPLFAAAQLKPEPLRVNELPLSASRFCESVESKHSDQSASAKIAKELGITAEPVRMDSMAKYATVAKGDASIYMRLPTRADYRENIWDHAAGAIAVEEAGGKVTDIHGRPLDFSRGRKLEDNAGILATNGRIHGAVVAAVSKHFR